MVPGTGRLLLGTGSLPVWSHVLVTRMRVVSGGLWMMTLIIRMVLNMTMVVSRWAAGMIVPGRVLGINGRVLMRISGVLDILWAAGVSRLSCPLLGRQSSHYWGAFGRPW